MKSSMASFGFRVGAALVGMVLVALVAAPGFAANKALQFDGVNDYVTFGADVTYLGLKTFTLEVWFYRTGSGQVTSTGSEGIIAVPLLTKGVIQTDSGDNRDINYFMGIQSSTNLLVGDYEEGQGQLNPSRNHPIIGVTTIQNNRWYHAAFTFDGTTERLYLNGNLEATVVVGAGRLPRWDSIQRAGLGVAIDSDGWADGTFQGVLDEPRIWKRARAQQAIIDSMGLELESAPGLNGRWGLNEGTGTIANNSIAGSPNGTLTNGPVWVDGSPMVLLYALDFGGTNAYVTFGQPSALKLAQFTLETWFRRDGNGVTATTGSGGVVAIPLVTKGRSQSADGGVYDCNYFLGIRGTDSVLVADFEEGTAGSSPGLNHPVAGVTTIHKGVWYHAAATYDGSSWRLYLNGILEATVAVNQPPQWQSRQHAGLATAFDTSGVASGLFDGVLDEVRIWNFARTRQVIQSTINDQISTPQTGLVARWALNEGMGTTVRGSAGTAITGTIMGANFNWVDPAPFNLVIDNPPDQPVLNAPYDGTTGVALSPTLDVTVSDPENDPLTVTFYGRRKSSSAGAPFTLAFLPDAQFYTAQTNGGTAAMFVAQAQWIVDNIAARNIVYAHQIGDISDAGDTYHVQWERAWSAMQLLENPSTTHLPQGLPYDVTVGNHDQTPGSSATGTTNYFNEFFGPTHFAGRPYYGGHYGSNNDNHFGFFSASGLDFIVISMEYDTAPDAPVLAWADSLLAAYPARRGIIFTHNLISAATPGVWSTQGQAVYDALKDNPNLALMLCGHNQTEGRRSDTYGGHTVHTILADYQGRTNGGNGWMRIMTFYPDENVLRVKTYSPTLGQWETDADSSSQFTLPIELYPLADWSVIGTMSGVPSGSTAAIAWPGLVSSSEYEWYVTVNDGHSTTTGPAWEFRTLSDAPPGAPSLLASTAIATDRIALGWTDNSANEFSFEIERSTGGSMGPFTPLVTVNANVTSYQNAGLAPASEYCYRVRAVNDAGASGWCDVACATTPAVTVTALDFGGTNAYVTFGQPSALRLPQFTLETWFRRDGNGVTATTGSGGVVAIPLVTKGRSQSADGGVYDCNYFLGIRGTDSVLVADFEEGTAGSTPGLNHPVVGTTTIHKGTWYHAAATYDGSTWRLYLNGALEATVAVNQPPQWQSRQHAALASALDTSGVASGYYDGVLDEVRIWNFARTQQVIQSTINDQIATPQTGLVARWALNEGSGTGVFGSAGTSVNGSIVGANYAWTGPAPFDIVIDDPPGQPVLVAPSDGALGVAVSPTLDVTVSDPENDPLDVAFYGRAKSGGSSAPFSIVILPDVQFYTSQTSGGTIGLFQAQTRWIANHIDSLNIVYAHQIGDFSNNGDSDHLQWERGWTAMQTLEDTSKTHMPLGFPYGVTVGNHDETPAGSATGTTNYYNEYFGVSHFAGRPYYGGHLGSNNDSHFELFSSGDLGFIAISMKYNDAPGAGMLNWADSLLKAYPARRGIIFVHNLISAANPGVWSAQGQATYNALRDNPNLLLMICGHNTTEGRRVDTYQGSVVHTVLADYQGRTNGGNGWLRIMKFYPEENVIRVQTYSPTLNQFEADADSSSQFTLATDLQPLASWVTIGTASGVSSGGHATMTWPGLGPVSSYEWYVTVTDGNSTTTGPVWDFTTRSAAPTATVVYPNGGEILAVGAEVALRWTADDDVEVTSVDLLLSRDGAAGSYAPIAMAIANTGSYDWTVDGAATANAFLKAVAHDADDNTGEDASDAAFSVTVITDAESSLPSVLALEIASAHPFNGAGAFGLAVPRASSVKISVYDVSGRRVATLVDAAYQPGRYRIAWNGATAHGSAASGIYFFRLEACGKILTKKIVLVR